MKNKISVGLDLNFNNSLEKYYNIIDETKNLVYFYKINPAFFLNDREKIKKIANYIKFCKCNWIYDGKIGDVPHTNVMYSEYLYKYLKADGTTLNPYLGSDSLQPFFNYKNKLNFILCRTTNKGAEKIQDKIYKKIYNIANQNKVHLIIPSNKEGYLKEAVQNCPESFILSPGIGYQGGKIKNISKEKIIYSISRSIINSNDPKKELEKYVNS